MSLELTYSSITICSFKFISQLTKLKKLKLFHCYNIINEGIDFLCELRNLRILKVIACKMIPNTSALNISMLTQITSLDLAGGSMQEFFSLTNLTHLRLSLQYYNLKLDTFINLKSLEVYSIPENIESITSLTSLKLNWILYVAIPSASLESLCKFKNLEILMIDILSGITIEDHPISQNLFNKLLSLKVFTLSKLFVASKEHNGLKDAHQQWKLINQ